MEVLVQTGVRYTEQGRTMLIDSELLATRGIMVYRSLKRWQLSDDAEPVDDATRDRILENVRLAFESKRYEVEIS